MATSTNTKAPHHSRSISLPSEPHPVVAQFDEELRRLNSSEAPSTSYSVISENLGGLQSLYNHLDEILLLPQNQQTLSQNRQAKWVDLVLNGSLRLLDLCGTARDALSQSKECLQDIQSMLRRRLSGELNIANEIVKYMNTRKKVKKTIKSCLKGVKASDRSDYSDALVGMLRGVEAATCDVLRSLFPYIAGKKTQGRITAWFSRLVLQDSEKKEATTFSGFIAFDEVLNSLVSHEKRSGLNVMQLESLRSDAMNLESEIQDLDEVLDSLYRHLVKTRARILNVLSN